jgi:sRNA-binding regulator protein Hfq
MNNKMSLPGGYQECEPLACCPQPRTRRVPPAPLLFHALSRPTDNAPPHRHAEIFYLQKQVQDQTLMRIVLDDGEQIEGYIEWWDQNSIKVRGRTKTLIYKSAVKYMYKLPDADQ